MKEIPVDNPLIRKRRCSRLIRLWNLQPVLVVQARVPMLELLENCQDKIIVSTRIVGK